MMNKNFEMNEEMMAHVNGGSDNLDPNMTTNTPAPSDEEDKKTEECVIVGVETSDYRLFDAIRNFFSSNFFS